MALLLLSVATYGLVTNKIPTTNHAQADAGKLVSLYVDGQTRIFPTEATTVGDLLKRADVTLDAGDLVEPSADTVLDKGPTFINVYRSRPIVVEDGDATIHGKSAYQNPELILDQLGIKIYPQDLIATAPVTDFVATGVVGEQITITRAKLVTLSDFDGNDKILRTQKATVGDFLAEQKIKLLPGDIVDPGVKSSITDGLRISLTRVNEQIVKEEETIPANVQNIRDPNLAIPATVVEQAGSDGTKVTTYRVTYSNGKVVAKDILKTEITLAAMPKIIAKGGAITTDTWSKLAWCESRGNPADNTGNGFYGAYQFSHSTWGGYDGYYNASDAPLSVQTDRAAQIQAVSGWRPWPVCAAGW